MPAYREIRPEFLELILSHEPWASAPRHPEVKIHGALVRGEIYLDDHEIIPSLWFQEGKIDGEVSLLGTNFKRSLYLQDSTVTGDLSADGLVVAGNLYLQEGTFADVYLRGAKVAGNLDLQEGTFAGVYLSSAEVAGSVWFGDSTVTENLSADGLVVAGNLYLQEGTFAGVYLRGAKVAGNVWFRDSTVTENLSANRLVVGGYLNLQEGTFADVHLRGAKVVSNVNLTGSTTITGELSADILEIGGDLFLREGGSFAEIRLPGARIGGDVQLAGSTFGGEFNLTGAAIRGELHLSSEWRKPAPTWQDGASLILRNAKVDALQAQRDSWNMPGKEKEKLLPTDLVGFVYNQLGGLDASGGTSMGDEPAQWLIDWIEAQRDHGKHYDPQPYTQLAQVLDAAGATEKAKSIRYAKFEHKLDHDRSMGTFRSVVLTLERYFVGYGVYPFLALSWFLGLVLVGGVLAQFSADASVRRWMGAWYSLENALPLIETNERFRNVVHGHPALVHFFHFQKAFGFVLATVLVGALTLLGG